MNFLEIVTLVVVCIGMLLAIQLAVNTRIVATRLLGLYLFCMAIFLAEPVAKKGVMHDIVMLLLPFLTFAIGPALFLYTRLQLQLRSWNNRDLWHFLPALVIFVLTLLSLPVESVRKEAQTDEIILYISFVVQLFSYTGSAFMQLLRHRSIPSSGTVESMQINFVRWIVYSSLLLFSFSVVSTFLGWNGTRIFVDIIQLLLSAIIFTVALLNGDILDRRQRYT